MKFTLNGRKQSASWLIFIPLFSLWFDTLMISVIFASVLSVVSAQITGFDVVYSPGEILPSGVTANAVTLDEANGFLYFVGFTLVSFDGQTYTADPDPWDLRQRDGFLTKHFINGTRIWTRILTGPDRQEAFSVTLHPVTNDLFVTGVTWGNIGSVPTVTPGQNDLFLSRFSSNGTQIYTRIIGTGNDEYGKTIALDTNDNRIYIGGCYDNNLATMSFHLVNGSTIDIFLQIPGYGERMFVQSMPNEAYITGLAYGAVDGQSTYGGSDVPLS
jgi:hypothetical protein